MRGKCLLALFILNFSHFFLTPGSGLSAQSAGNAAEKPAAGAPAAEKTTESGEKAKPKPLSADEVLRRDIETSPLSALTEMCLELGLSADGGRETLIARLLSHYKLDAAALESVKAPVPESAQPPAEGEPAVDGETAAEGAAEGESETAAEGEPAAEKKPLNITINSARTTEFFTIDAVNEEYVRLSGGVSITLQDGEVQHTLSAEMILYNRTRNIMSASGGVAYEKKEGDTIVSFKGEGLTVNLDDWSTVFSEGFSERAVTEGENRYRFAGEVISRSADDSTVMKSAEISNAGNEEAYWSIAASRLWLLPGSDWAVANAILKVGEIPVLWLPFFVYPGNEIVFHPVLGYRSREGTLLQTTTYLLGRPKAQGTSEEMASITNIMGSSTGMEKQLEGVFLRSTGVKARTETEPRLSILADAYANLGFYLGTDFALPARGPFGETTLSAGIGISRDVLKVGTGYSPFAPKFDGTSNWHESQLFSLTLPFRYRFITAGSVSGSAAALSQASLSWSFPLYSDPYINNDFMNRSEDSDVFTNLKSATTPDMVVKEDSISSYVWKLDSHLNFTFPAISPYISTLSVNSLSSSLTFNLEETRNITPAPGYLTPGSRFFYPSKLVPFSVSLSISGTLLSLDSSRKETTVDPPPEREIYPGLGSPIPPWENGEENAADKGASGNVYDLRPPEIARTTEKTVFGGHRLTLDYQLNPTGSTEYQFDNIRNSRPAGRPLNDQSNVSWDFVSQLYNVNLSGNIGFTLSESRNIWSTSVRLYGTSAWQDYIFNDLSSAESDRRTTRSTNRISSSGEYNFTLSPFYGSDVWNQTNFQYTLRGILTQTKYDAPSDSWIWESGSWKTETIEIHRTQANFNANIMDKTQSLMLSAELPPRESAVSGDATARIWISETNARSRIRKPFEDPFYEPVYFTELFRFSKNISLRQYAVYTPEIDAWTTLTTDLSLWEFTASFLATRSRSYVWNSGLLTSGWYEAGTEETLNPQELRFMFNKTWSTDQTKPSKFMVRVNTGLTYDLRRYTYSKFTFNLGLNLSINKFIDINLSSSSENNEIFRYFYTPAGTNLVTKNPLEDLFDSFRFDNNELRRESGFKIKGMNLDFVHHLGDWDATLGVQIAQELYERQYRFNTTISFLLQWKPVKELKTKLDYDKDGFRYE